MKKNIKHIIVGILGCFTIISCEDFLEVTPESTLGVDSFYRNTSEAEIALSGIYSILADDDVYGEVLGIIMDTGTDEAYYNRRFNEAWTVGLYRHTTADRFIERLWTGLYEAINLCNLFIEQLDESSFESEEFNRLLAEARFLRAHSYQILASRYEEVPMPLSSTKNLSSNDLAVSSLETIYDQIESDFLFAATHLYNVNDQGYIEGRANAMAARGLLARVYLKMAGFPLKDVTKYEKAKEQCQIIMESNIHSLVPSTFEAVVVNEEEARVATEDGYRNLFLNYIQNTYDTRESIFEISFRYLRDQGLFTDGRFGAINGIPFGFGGGGPGFPFSFALVNTTPTLRDAFKDNDVRKAWNIANFFYNNRGDALRPRNALVRDFTPGKYRRWEPVNFDDLDFNPSNFNAGVTINPETEQPYTQEEIDRLLPEPFILLEDNSNPSRNFTGINFPVLRYSDVLLMFAEADNKINGGPTASAIDALNQVRERAGLLPIADDTDAAIALESEQTFFDEIVEERFRELCFEGLRLHDLIRWELLDERLKKLQNDIINDDAFSPTNADHQAFQRSQINFDITRHLSLPYPLQEVNLNAELDQKEEWQ